MKKFLMGISTLLASDSLTQTAEKVNEILDGLVGPCFSVLGSLGLIYVIILGVQYAKSESDEKRAEIKKRIVNLCIGLVVIIIMITMCYAIKWESIIPQLFGYIESE